MDTVEDIWWRESFIILFTRHNIVPEMYKYIYIFGPAQKLYDLPDTRLYRDVARRRSTLCI